MKGFTLVETIIVVAIIGIIVIIVVPGSAFYSRSLALDRAATELAQNIRWAQQMAMSSRESQKGTELCAGSYIHGVSFKDGDSSYIIYIDCNDNWSYQPADDKIEEVSLGNITIDVVNSDSMDIFFIPPDPNITIIPTQPSNKAVITLSNGVDEKVITVNKVGLISVE